MLRLRRTSPFFLGFDRMALISYVSESLVQAESKVDAVLQIRFQAAEGVCPPRRLPHRPFYAFVIHRKLGFVDGNNCSVGTLCLQLNGYATPCATRGPFVHDPAVLFDLYHFHG